MDLVRALTRSTALGVAGRARAGAHADRLGDRHARRRARPPPRVRRRPAPPARRLGGRVRWDGGRRRRRRGAGRDAGDRGDRYLVAAAVVFGLAARQPLADPAAGARGRAVRARGRPGDLAASPARRWPASPALAVDASSLVYLELPLRAGPFRAPLVYGRPDTWDGFWYVVLGRAVPGQPGRPVRRPAAQDRRPRRPDASPSSASLAPLIPVGFVATVRAAAALRAADRHVAVADHLLLRRVLRERGHRPLLPRADPDRLDLAGDPGRRRGRTGWPAALARSPAAPATPASRPDRRRARPSRSRPSCWSPTVLDAPGPPARPSTRAATASAADWTDRALGGHGAGRGHRELVELLDAAMVCTARRGPAPGPHHRRRSDAPRRGLGEHHRRDRRQPRQPARLRHPRRPATRSPGCPTATELEPIDGAGRRSA